MVKTLPFQCRGYRFNPGWGIRFYMPVVQPKKKMNKQTIILFPHLSEAIISSIQGKPVKHHVPQHHTASPSSEYSLIEGVTLRFHLNWLPD